MRRIIKLFSSMRVALVLLAVVILLSIIATLIPQGQGDAFYINLFGPQLGSLIIRLHLFNYYLTPLFLVPGALFFFNLLVCTIKRITTRIRSRASKRFGPDIIHISLLLIMILGVYSLFTRKEAVVYLAKGDSVELENGMEIRLRKFDFFRYPDGRPSDWISHIEVFLQGELLREYAIEVNKPFSYGSYKIFQSSYRDEAIVIAGDPSGTEVELQRGDYLTRNGAYLFFYYHSEKEGETFLHFIYRDDETEREMVLQEGDVWNGYRIEETLISSYTGLQIVKTQVFRFILYTLLLLVVGLCVTFYQKLGEKDR
jgi:hypothetical protein